MKEYGAMLVVLAVLLGTLITTWAGIYSLIGYFGLIEGHATRTAFSFILGTAAVLYSALIAKDLEIGS